MSKGRAGYPRLILKEPYQEVHLKDLGIVSNQQILKEATKYVTKEGKSRLLCATDRNGVVIVEKDTKKKKIIKRNKYQGKEDFDRVKWRVMKKFFTRIDNQKQQPLHKPQRQFSGKKNGQRPIHSRDGGNHGGSNKRK